MNSMHLVLLAFKSSWRPRKESYMALKLVWRLVNTVSKEGPEVYTMGLCWMVWTGLQVLMGNSVQLSSMSVAAPHRVLDLRQRCVSVADIRGSPLQSQEQCLRDKHTNQADTA